MATAPASTHPAAVTPPPPGETAAFPLGLCAATIASLGAALLLAAADVKWGVAPPPTDALEFAWVYVNVALGIVWLVVWPALVARGRRLGDPGRWPPLMELLTILIGALPLAGAAAALAWPGWPVIAQAAAVQGAVGLLAMGMLTWRGRPAIRLLSGLLVALALVLPAAGYIASEFYPAADARWQAFIPLFAISRAAGGEGSGVLRWMVLAYAGVGGAMWAAGPFGRQPRD